MALPPPSTIDRLTHFRWILLARLIDDRCSRLKAQGEVAGSVFTGKGQEAYSAAAGMSMRAGDIFAPLIRDQAGRMAFGEPAIETVRAVLGRKTGWMRGRDGNIHRGDLAHGIIPMISHLGAMISVTNGMLLARRLRGTLGDSIAVVSLGDGGMNCGAAHEGLNQMAVERLPVVVLVADNQLAYSTFSNRTHAARHLVDRAIGYGMASWTLDGTDPDACLSVVPAAIAAARAGGGPQFVVASLLRLAGHGTHDDASYVGNDLKSRFADCVQVAEQRLLAEGLLSAADLERLRSELSASIADAVEQARSEPQPKAIDEDWAARSCRDLVDLVAP